jgi:hypothetical protein
MGIPISQSNILYPLSVLLSVGPALDPQIRGRANYLVAASGQSSISTLLGATRGTSAARCLLP